METLAMIPNSTDFEFGRQAAVADGTSKGLNQDVRLFAPTLPGKKGIAGPTSSLVDKLLLLAAHPKGLDRDMRSCDHLDDYGFCHGCWGSSHQRKSQQAWDHVPAPSVLWAWPWNGMRRIQKMTRMIKVDKLTEGVESSSVEQLRDCVASLEPKQRRVLREAVKKASYVHPCENMPEVPSSLKELWPTLGERFGPYNFLFAEDPTEAIRGKLGDSKFVDPEFTELMPQKHLAYRLAEDPNANCIWPADGPDPQHVKQVTMPDCEFMASYAAMAMYPQKLQEVFTNVTSGQLDPNGIYTFKVTYKGRVGYVVVDDLVPGRPGSPLGAYPAHGTIWISLLEKMTAKLSDTNYEMMKGHGNRYDAGLEIRTGMDMVCLMYGGHTLSVNTPESNDVKFVDFIEFLIQEPLTVITCCPKNPKRGDGLIAHHAYGVVGMCTVDDIQLVKLQNPWGHSEWTGDWSDKSTKWEEHPQVAEKLMFNPEDQGSFYISRQDFVDNFTSFLYNRITPLRAADDDGSEDWDSMLGEYSNGTDKSVLMKRDGIPFLESDAYGPIHYCRSKYKLELNMKKPCGPGTAHLYKKTDGSPLGYSAGLGDFNWYVGPAQSAPEEGIYEKKYRLNKVGGLFINMREWDKGEKALHWRGVWTNDEGESMSFTGDSMSSLQVEYAGKSYSLEAVMFDGCAMFVPHDYMVIVNVNKVQRFRREIQLRVEDGSFVCQLWSLLIDSVKILLGEESVAADDSC
eukprot:s3850_g10.t4